MTNNKYAFDYNITESGLVIFLDVNGIPILSGIPTTWGMDLDLSSKTVSQLPKCLTIEGMLTVPESMLYNLPSDLITGGD